MLTLPPRSGPRPRTTLTNPHQQMDQHGPAEWGDRLVSEVGSWPGVLVAPSAISVPGSRAFWLKPTDALGPESAFMTGTEFAHVHPPYDGSLHLTLPEEIATRIQTLGWGELHPLALQGLLPKTITMIYAPRDASECGHVLSILQICHRFATGTKEISQA
jgi:hypothetical protein